MLHFSICTIDLVASVSQSDKTALHRKTKEKAALTLIVSFIDIIYLKSISSCPV